ncbi:MAG TPA: M48 family metallopeptidase [Archangium sp.]|nr:M48 family metallopeptidase [Archangium sp.]
MSGRIRRERAIVRPVMETIEFQGGLFSDEVQGGRAGARIRLGLEGLEAETPTGERFRLPYADCQLEQGGASGKMIFCHGPGRRLTLFSEQKGFAEALARSGGDPIVEQLKSLGLTARKERNRYQLQVVLGLVAMVLLTMGAFRLLKMGATRAVHALPVSVDRKIGGLAMEAMSLDGPKVTDPVLVGAMEKMVSRLEPHVRIPGLEFQVTVVDAPIVNAYCLPGGRIVVYTGLLKAARRPEQVAGVLGHEMAHATLRHGLERIAQSAGAVVALELLLQDVGGLLAMAVELARHGVLTSYGREQETAADMEGAEMMLKAGMDPVALAEFFAILQEQHGDVPDSLAWLSSHPQLAERQTELRRRAEQSRPAAAEPLGIDWDEVVRHAKDPQSKHSVDSKSQVGEHPARAE